MTGVVCLAWTSAERRERVRSCRDSIFPPSVSLGGKCGRAGGFGAVLRVKSDNAECCFWRVEKWRYGATPQVVEKIRENSTTGSVLRMCFTDKALGMSPTSDNICYVTQTMGKAGEGD
jgi:hypothetical protein